MTAIDSTTSTDAEAREQAAGVRRVDYTALLTPAVEAEIRALPFLVSNGMAKQDLAATFEFYSKRFVRQLPDFVERLTADTVVADVGCGAGWLALTCALETPARIVGIETDADCLVTARALARILGLEDRVRFVEGDLSAGLPLADRAADVVYCIEVLEHVFRDRACVAELARVVGEMLVMTTPNGAFPVVAHDTRLPLAHWLPVPLRKRYARLAGRDPEITHNQFWTPAALAGALPGLERVSGFLHYASLDRYLDTYPFYMPYDLGYWQHAPSPPKLAYYRLLDALPGGAKAWALPSLAGVFRRRATPRRMAAR